jgi:hypothetical protein
MAFAVANGRRLNQLDEVQQLLLSQIACKPTAANTSQSGHHERSENNLGLRMSLPMERAYLFRQALRNAVASIRVGSIGWIESSVVVARKSGASAGAPADIRHNTSLHEEWSEPEAHHVATGA